MSASGPLIKNPPSVAYTKLWCIQSCLGFSVRHWEHDNGENREALPSCSLVTTTPQALLTQRWEERDHGKLSGALEVKKGLACRRNTWAEMSTMHWEPETSVFWSLVNVRSRKLFRVLHNCLLRLGDHSGRGDEKILGARESRCL